MNQREIIDLMREWKDEVKQILKDDHVAIENLHSAQKSFESQTKSWLQRFMPVITILATAVAFILIVLILNYFIPWKEISFANIKIIKSASEQK